MDSFTENPFVKAIGGALGLEPLMGMGGGGDGSGGPTAPPSPPVPAPKPGRSNVQPTTPREFRQHAPEPRAQRGGAPQGSPGMNMPGMMSPEILMNPAVQQLLGQYGVPASEATSTAQHANPNLFVTNEAAFQKHPVMAGLLEHGLEGLAFTHPGANVGENISAVARSLMDSQAARTEKYNNMLMMPFAQAQQVANLKGTALEQFFKYAQAQRDQALVKHYGDMDDWHTQANQIAQDRQTDLQEFHAQIGNLQLERELDKIPLNNDETTKLGALLQGTPNHRLTEIDPQALQAIVGPAHQRMIDAAEGNKNKRAAIGANRHSTNDNTTHNDRVDPSVAGAYKDEFDKADAEYKNFVNQLGTNVVTVSPVDFTGDDGKTYPAGTRVVQNSALAGAAARALDKKRQDAAANLHSVVTPSGPPAAMAVPGSGMTKKRKTTTESNTRSRTFVSGGFVDGSPK